MQAAMVVESLHTSVEHVEFVTHSLACNGCQNGYNCTQWPYRAMT